MIIKDDGDGIDPNIIARKCLEKKIVSEEELKNLDDKQKLRLIFKPGFSTKETVSEISGRGVGMDVVYSNITKLGGTIDIKTEKGRGTEFIIKLPS